jgi:hypothetical protein
MMQKIELSEEEVIDFEKRLYGIDTSIKKPLTETNQGQKEMFFESYLLDFKVIDKNVFSRSSTEE